MSKFAVVKMRIPMIVTKKIASFITVLALAFFSCTNCQKEPASLLAGTSWECKEDGSIMVFNDNHSGLYYCKSAIDDVYDEFFSSFDFVYEISGTDLKVQIAYSNRTAVVDFIVEDNGLTTKGDYHILHFVRIEHKSPK